ncbi:MAG TPA: dihydroorotate dehydrogenase electron transfer subunit [Candidatus Marinimicrobia bacterium]|nr:dihydroorotate dehydrogenase electron transfer subunit [Candidatus Neomarinimicrobiota bacterium]
MKCVATAIIRSNQKVADGIFLASLEAPEIAGQCLPGQFINIYFPETTKIFPRPFSIAGASDSRIKLLYKVIGSQTTLMSGWSAGQKIKILGPLGNIFDIQEQHYRDFILLGGGVGAAPLMFLRDELVKKGIKPYFFIGAKTKAELPVVEDSASHLILTTDDGSVGLKGNVVEHFLRMAENYKTPTQVSVCGPDMMMKVLKDISLPQNMDVFVSLEKTMACGLGLCQGCVVETTSGKYNGHYALVCKDGPVFNIKDVKFND